MDKFWMVWRADSGGTFKKHTAKLLAEVEQKRLALANPNVDFFVLEAITKARKADVDVVVLKDVQAHVF